MMVRTSFDMGSPSFDQESKNRHGIMSDNSIYSYSNELSSSSESDLVEDGSSSGSSSPTSPASPKVQNGPLGDMSSLLQQLPFKRGLSKHFQGKSQSFTSLSSVTCLDDLAKPENPYHKKLKSCKSYVGLSEATHRSSQPNLKSVSSMPKLVSKKSTSRGSCSNALGAKRNGSFIGNAMRPPTHPPHRSNSAANFSNQTPLLA